MIPDWIDQELWEGFLEIRKKKKAVDSKQAIQLIINKLIGFREQGFDPNEIIKESIMNSWKSVFKPKNQGGNFPTKSQNVDDWVNKGPKDARYEEEQVSFEGFARSDDGSFGESKTSH